MAYFIHASSAPAPHPSNILYQGNGLQEEMLLELLVDVTRRLQIDAARRAGELEMTPSAKLTLRVLSSMSKGATQGALAKKVGRSAATMTRIVDVLLDQQLVERVEHPCDRRCHLVRVTETGRETALNLDGEARGTVYQALKGERPEDVGLLLLMLKRITARVS